MRCVVENADKKIVFETKKIVYVKKWGSCFLQIGFDGGEHELFCYNDDAERDAEYERVLGCWSAGDRKDKFEGHLTGN